MNHYENKYNPIFNDKTSDLVEWKAKTFFRIFKVTHSKMKQDWLAPCVEEVLIIKKKIRYKHFLSQ